MQSIEAQKIDLMKVKGDSLRERYAAMKTLKINLSYENDPPVILKIDSFMAKDGCRTYSIALSFSRKKPSPGIVVNTLPPMMRHFDHVVIGSTTERPKLLDSDLFICNVNIRLYGDEVEIVRQWLEDLHSDASTDTD